MTTPQTNFDHKELEMLDKNIELIINEKQTIQDKLSKSPKLERFRPDIALFISLAKDYYQGNYRSIPYKSISAGIISLLYILNPIDIIPDFIPVIGYIDDVLILTFCLKMVEKDLQKYQKWQQTQADASTPKTAANTAATKSSHKKQPSAS